MFDKIKTTNDPALLKKYPMIYMEHICDGCGKELATIRLWADPDIYYCGACARISAIRMIEEIKKDMQELGLDGE